jgi:hypothetical protein
MSPVFSEIRNILKYPDFVFESDTGKIYSRFYSYSYSYYIIRTENNYIEEYYIEREPLPKNAEGFKKVYSINV